MIPTPLRNTKNPEPDDEYDGGEGGEGGGAIDDNSTEASTNDASDTEDTSGAEDSDAEEKGHGDGDDSDDSDDDSTIAGGEGGGVDDDDGEGGGGDENSDDDDSPHKKQTKKPKKKTASGSGSGAGARKKNQEDDLTLLGVPHGIFGDDEGSGDSDDSDADGGDADRDSSEYFQKLANTVRESYVETYHPEAMSHNYDEIQTLARVVRNADGVIVDDLHRTIPIMTKYEKTRILGQRAKQLNEGAPAFVKIDSTVIDGYLIAVKELEQKKTPFIIRRPLPNGGSEYWRVQDLEIL